MGLLDQIKLKENGIPATLEAIQQAENDLRCSLPPLLKQIYENIANGGIGPGYKILGVVGGHTTDENDSIADLYNSLCLSDPEDPIWNWPRGVVPFCSCGCAIYSCFDSTKANHPIIWFDPNGREIGEPMGLLFRPHKPTLSAWLESWISGDDLWADTYGS